MSDVSVGDMLGESRLDGLARRGETGEVYRATQVGLERTVAVKVISAELAADQAFRARFKREVRLVASLDHPHLVPIHQIGESGGRLFLSTRWVDGHDLGQEIATTTALDPDRVVRLLGQIAGALDAVHAAGLVHRDVKPANVLIEQRPDGEHAYLTDAGAGPSCGTVDYAAPEILAGGAPSARSDIYALGCTLYEALAGTAPFPRATRPAASLPPSLHALRPDLPAGLDAVLAQALAEDPEQRQPSAQRVLQEAATALNDAPASPPSAAAAGDGTAADAAEGGARPQHPAGRARTPALLLAGLLGAAAIAVVVADSATDAPPAERAKPLVAEVAQITRIPLGAETPRRPLEAAGHVYVLDLEGRALIVVDSSSGRRVSKIQLPGEPQSRALDRAGRRLWIGLRDRRLVEIALPANRVVGRPLSIPIVPDDLVALRSGLVVMQSDEMRIVRVDPLRRRLVGRAVRIGGYGTFLSADRGRGLLALNGAPGSDRPYLFGFDERLRTTTQLRFEASLPLDVKRVDGALWITDFDGARILRIDPRTGKRAAPPIRVGRNPTMLAVDATSVWVVNRGDGSVTRIDRATGRALRPAVPTGPVAGSITARAGGRPGVWVPRLTDLVRLEAPDQL